MFEFLHPGKTGMFVYDNSTNHSCYPPGALGILPGVNKGPGQLWAGLRSASVGSVATAFPR